MDERDLSVSVPVRRDAPQWREGVQAVRGRDLAAAARSADTPVIGPWMEEPIVEVVDAPR